MLHSYLLIGLSGIPVTEQTSYGDRREATERDRRPKEKGNRVVGARGVFYAVQLAVVGFGSIYVF